MTSKVTIVELTIYEKIYPLTSGYLQAYACKDPDTKRAYSFEKYSTTVNTPYVTVLQDLQKSDSDVYAFSCYLWNMGLVKSLVKSLLETKPNAHFMLGGPQVMHHAHKYLNSKYENLVLCNGEGEKTFSDFLRELINHKPDFSNVRGMSFYREGEIVTTEKHERIRLLDEIPSPFLGGIFDQPYLMATFETNRGCPFSCGFCYWGAAINAKVLTFSEERIREELSWLSKHNCMYLYIADANWGIYQRDIGLSEYIADLSKTYRTPNVVFYSAAKNKPERMTQITEIFTDAGIITSQPVSLQTMNQTSLEMVERTNIKLSSYVEIQEKLNQKKISSFTELIWPLPGETFPSLKAGIDKLCEAKADTIIIYPQVLLHNTSLYHKREELGFVTRTIDEEIGEVDLVVQTAEVSYEEYVEGINLFYALHLLHNTRSLSIVSYYLNKKLNVNYSEIFSSFADFCKQHVDNPVVGMLKQIVEKYDYYKVFNYGKVVHFALHAYRSSFDELLCQFMMSQEWWDDQDVRAMFEIDLINKPYVYSNTAIKEIEHPFQHLKVHEVVSRSYLVQIPEKYLPILEEAVVMNDGLSESNGLFRVDHKRLQYPYMKAQSLDHNISYCHGMILRVEHMLPVWTKNVANLSTSPSAMMAQL